MRMIHVLRKPLSEGTVAANTLKHGTGGLNIDASRIGSGHHLPAGRVTSKRLAGDGGLGAGAGREGPREVFTPRSVSGRWPANVILQHLDGCRCDGVNWVCEPGCPVARLDEQTGRSVSRIGKPRGSKKPGAGWGMTATGAEYDDAGGASRFYKQVGGKIGDEIDLDV